MGKQTAATHTSSAFSLIPPQGLHYLPCVQPWESRRKQSSYRPCGKQQSQWILETHTVPSTFSGWTAPNQATSVSGSMPPGLLEIRDSIDYQCLEITNAWFHSSLGIQFSWTPPELDTSTAESAQSLCVQILKPIFLCLGKFRPNWNKPMEIRKQRRCVWNGFRIVQAEHVLLGGSAALEIPIYFILHLKHLECPAMERDQPYQVSLLEIRRGTVSLFAGHSLRGDWKGFLFQVLPEQVEVKTATRSIPGLQGGQSFSLPVNCWKNLHTNYSSILDENVINWSITNC